MARARVVVCGTKYGFVYLSALLAAGGELKLAGILARGSQRSRRYAQEFGVPLFRSVAELPRTIDLACVAVGSRLLDGDGTDLACELLARRISVLQEHPVHPGEIERCLAVAREHGVHYHVNTHYPHLPAVRTFLERAAERRRRSGLRFIDAIVSPQLTYSLLDVLGRAAGGLSPFLVSPRVDWDGAQSAALAGGPIAYRATQAVIGTVPLFLRQQSLSDPRDPDNHSFIAQRVSLGDFDQNLVLVSPYGPVIECETFRVPGYQTQDQSFTERKQGLLAHSAPLYQLVSAPPAPASIRELLLSEWPGAVLGAVRALRDAAQGAPSDPFQSADYLLALGRAWVSAMQAFGPAEPCDLAPPAPPVSADRSVGSLAEDAAAPAELHDSNRAFYADLDRRLAGAERGADAVFLNWGYVPDGTPRDAPVPAPSGEPQRHAMDLVLELVGACSLAGAEVLDVGCGRGGALALLQRRFSPKRVVGVDLSPDNVAFCRARHGARGLTFIEGNAEALPLPDASFDVVLNLESSAAYRDLNAFFAEVARVLRPDGSFLYGDLFERQRLDVYRDALTQQGFVPLSERDVTRNVLKARELLAHREREVFTGPVAHGAGPSRALDVLLAPPGSELYRGLESGELCYWLFRFRRVRAPVRAQGALPPLRDGRGERLVHALEPSAPPSPARRARGVLRVFCIPYAGGGASIYRGWSELAPPGVVIRALDLPGREALFGQPPLASMEAAVEHVLREIGPELDAPFVFYGHSLGAAIAFHVTRRLRALRERLPEHLVVAARAAPHRAPRTAPIADLPEREFKAELRRLGQTPEAVLENHELMQLLLPTLRSDFRLDETLSCVPEPPLPCPITAFGGLDDREVTRDELDAWREHTAGGFTLKFFAGDHFFLHPSRRSVLEALLAAVEPRAEADHAPRVLLQPASPAPAPRESVT